MLFFSSGLNPKFATDHLFTTAVLIKGSGRQATLLCDRAIYRSLLAREPVGLDWISGLVFAQSSLIAITAGKLWESYIPTCKWTEGQSPCWRSSGYSGDDLSMLFVRQFLCSQGFPHQVSRSNKWSLIELPERVRSNRNARNVFSWAPASSVCHADDESGLVW
jgi:hypothetical protein